MSTQSSYYKLIREKIEKINSKIDENTYYPLFNYYLLYYLSKNISCIILKILLIFKLLLVFNYFV